LSQRQRASLISFADPVSSENVVESNEKPKGILYSVRARLCIKMMLLLLLLLTCVCVCVYKNGVNIRRVAYTLGKPSAAFKLELV